MNKEPRFIVVRDVDFFNQFLAHQGHKQYWTEDRYLAMEYTRKDVAEALAKLHGGTVEAI